MPEALPELTFPLISVLQRCLIKALIHRSIDSSPLLLTAINRERFDAHQSEQILIKSRKKKNLSSHFIPSVLCGKLARTRKYIYHGFVGFHCARILGLLQHFSFAVQSPKDLVASLTSNCLCLKATCLAENVGPCFEDGLIGNKIWSEEKTWTVQGNILWDLGFGLSSDVSSTSLWR